VLGGAAVVLGLLTRWVALVLALARFMREG